MDERYFTIEEIATRFKVTRQTVQNWLREGKLDSVKLGRSRRILESSVDRMLKEGSTVRREGRNTAAHIASESTND